MLKEIDQRISKSLYCFDIPFTINFKFIVEWFSLSLHLSTTFVQSSNLVS